MTSRRRGRPRHGDVLTPAEWRVAEQVRHGLTNRRIAERGGVSLNAVKFHVANALAKLGLASRRELMRWGGVAADAALARRRARGIPIGTGEGAMLGQIARNVRNAEEARIFYRDRLGLDELYSFGTLAFFDLGGVRLMLAEGEGAGGDSILYFKVGDVHAEQARLEAKGVRFVSAPHRVHRHADGTEEWMAFFEDNEGRPLALMSRIAP